MPQSRVKPRFVCASFESSGIGREINVSFNLRDSVHVVTQFSVFLINKPGILARICQKLADDKVNMLALTVMDSTEHGVLRFVAEKPEPARACLASLEVPRTEAQVLAAEMPNRPGGLADMLQRLAAARVHIDYAYCTSGAAQGKSLAILRVSDVKRAEKILGERHPTRRERIAPRKTSNRRR